MNDQQISEIAGILHRKWADAFDAHEFVKNEKDDGSTDWEHFHSMRLEMAKNREDHFRNLKNDYIGENREAINRDAGL